MSRPTDALINLLCRICGQENKKCIPIFAEGGRMQSIHKKIRSCLPIVVHEKDNYPKQICLTCLHKVDATYELFHLCKEGEIAIAQKLNTSIRHDNDLDDDTCVYVSTVDEKLKLLNENSEIKIGDSVIVSLVPAEPVCPSPHTIPGTMVSTVTSIPGTMVAPVTASAAPVISYDSPTPGTAAEGVYPEGLIQVLPSSKPVIYPQRDGNTNTLTPPRRSMPMPKRRAPPPPPPPPTTTPKKQNQAIAQKSRLAREGEQSVPPPKKSMQVCQYCKRPFPDDIIDHHVSLHLRQSFFTCIDCNKNFRSEEAMSRHRCGTTVDSIDLDNEPENDPICL